MKCYNMWKVIGHLAVVQNTNLGYTDKEHTEVTPSHGNYVYHLITIDQWCGGSVYDSVVYC